MTIENIKQVYVIAIDIEKYSLRDTKSQSEIIYKFTEHLKLKKEKRNITFLPTGDGVAVIFNNMSSSNTLPLYFAFSLLQKIEDCLLQKIEDYNKKIECKQCDFEVKGYCTKCNKYNIRIGIDSGDVITYKDINGNDNFAGKPLNNAFRIMGLSYRNKLAISEKTFDNIKSFNNSAAMPKRIVRDNGLVKHGEQISIYRLEPPKVARDYIERLNKLFNTKLKAVKFIKELDDIPLLLPASDEVPKFDVKLKEWLGDGYQQKIGKLKEKFEDEKRPNDPHAISAKKVEDSKWHYYTTDYATIAALRQEGKKPNVIYSTVIVFCIEKKEIYLHIRKKGTQYADCYHVFGGGYVSAASPNRLFDSHSLIKTAMREVLEETGLSIQWNEKVKMIHIKPKAGGEEFVLLGVNVTPDNVKHVTKTHRETWEGFVKPISFNKLYSYLLNKKNKWCPTGMVVLLSWLALGAPGCEPETRFGRYTAQELFETVLEELIKRQKNNELFYDNKKGFYYRRS